MKSTPRLPLNALRVFEAVARAGSMARAAEALNVQPSAVSMQMKNLADYVGLPLVARAGNRLELTVHGQALLPRVVAGLAGIEEAVASLRGTARKRPFTLSVLPAFLHLWLLPRLADFEREHPGFRLQVLASRQIADLAAGEADAAVRLGAGRWAGVRATRLMDEGLVPVCAPALRRRVGVLRPGEMPARVTLLHSTVDPWERWAPHARHDQHAGVVIDDALAVLRAAEEGQGVALMRSRLVEASVAQGRLITVGEMLPYRWSYYWVTPQDARGQASPAQVVLDWLRREVRGAAGDGASPDGA